MSKGLYDVYHWNEGEKEEGIMPKIIVTEQITG